MSSLNLKTTGSRPFEDKERIIQCLESLDTTNTTPRYFHRYRQEGEVEENDSEEGKWIAIANNLDTSAKILIRYALVKAAENKTENADEWVEIARKLDADEEPDARAVKFLEGGRIFIDLPSSDELAKSEIENCLSKLNQFTESAKVLTRELTKSLDRFKKEE